MHFNYLAIVPILGKKMAKNTHSDKTRTLSAKIGPLD